MLAAGSRPVWVWQCLKSPLIVETTFSGFRCIPCAPLSLLEVEVSAQGTVGESSCGGSGWQSAASKVTTWIACQASGASPTAPPAAALSCICCFMQLVGDITVANCPRESGVSWCVQHTFKRQLRSRHQATYTAAAAALLCIRELPGC